MKKTLILASLLAAICLSADAQTFRPQHQTFGTNCAACHTPDNAIAGNQFVTPNDKACLACHGSYDTVAKRLEGKLNGEPNPHASHHYGKGIECTACHNEHKPSAVYCNNCHEFKYQAK